MFWDEPLVHLLVIAVLAALATLLLFKWLGSQAFVKKEDKGLTVMLTGAAAGFAIIGVGLYYADTQLVKLLPEEPPRAADSSLLTIRGKIDFSAGGPTNEGILFTFEPPNQTVERNGDFTIENVPVLKDVKTRIHATKDGDEFDVIVLDDKHIQRDATDPDSSAYVLRRALEYGEPASSNPGERYDATAAGVPKKIENPR